MNAFMQILARAQNPQLHAQLESVRHKAYYAAELEARRVENNVQVEAVRAEANYRQGQIDHQNRLTQMERELEHKIEFAQIESLMRNSDELATLNRSVISGALENIQTRSNVRSEIFKTVMGAVTQEKLARAAHKRQMELEEMRHKHDMEKLSKQSAEHRAGAYFDRLCSYVLAMMEKGLESEAEAAVAEFARAFDEAVSRAAAAGL